MAIAEAETWIVSAEDLHNLNRYTPLEGYELTGRVRQAFVRGQPAYHREDDGSERFGKPGFGQHVRRESKVGA
ncbi:MAG: hypothetical protein P8Y07_13065 [Gemmatimonadales bacterium]